MRANLRASSLRSALSFVPGGSFFGLVRAFLSLWLPSSARFVGGSAVSLKSPSDPIGRLKMTPSFDKIAADYLGIVAFLCHALMERLLSAPHASSAAFMNGAAIVNS